MQIRTFRWDQAPESLRQLRHQVFVGEQNVPPELEWDDQDAIAEHYLMTDGRDRALAVARVFADPADPETAHVGRMAVAREARGQGLGSQLLRHLMDDAAGRYRVLTLNAQEHATDFYGRHGFHLTSEPFMEAGIPHREMRCFAPALAAAVEPDAGIMPLRLGHDDRTWTFEKERHWSDLMRSLCAQAGRRIRIYDRFLSHERYDDAVLADLLSALARRHRATEIRLLIHEDRPLVERRHRLVELMHRLPSSVSLRLVNTGYPSEDAAFTLIDDSGVLYRHEADEAAGFARFQAGGRVKLLGETFQRMWDYARPSLELRRMPL